MNHSVKTPLFGTLRKAFRMALAADKRETSSEEVVQRHEATMLNRRKFLENSGKTLLLGGLAPNLLLGMPKLGARSSFQGAATPNIAIIGAGMAGLNALHTLKKAGYDATIYEASGRTSGRIFSVQGAMGEGTWAEFGAEFIDTNHKDMWDLVKEFNLDLIDYAQESETKLHKEAFFFGGKHYSLAQAVEAFRGFAGRMEQDMKKLPKEISYQTKDPHAKKFDNMSLSEYLEKVGATGWIKRFIEVAYESEYGLSPQVQSSLNLLTLISPDTEKGEIELFGESDERYKTRGGNQMIPEALAKKYDSHIELHQALESIRPSGSGYHLNFSKKKDVKADFVIIAIPFTRLRRVDIGLTMPQVKWDCINKMGYGMNAKLMIGMKSHFWRKKGYGGLVYADNGVPNGWDNAQLQTGEDDAAGLSILFGGKLGLDVGKGSAESQKDIYLPKWNQIYKGATEQFNGKVARMHWPSYPFTMGSYICPTVGQKTSFLGVEADPVGNVFFAGEHCGGDFSGFMNGAALSGRVAAEGILAKVGAK
jgi:monoamine oxidase